MFGGFCHVGLSWVGGWGAGYLCRGLGDRLDALGDHTLAGMIDWAGWIDGWVMGGKEGARC